MKSLHQMTSKSKQPHKMWPISHLINLSYLSQNMYIKHEAMICTFITVQTILEVAIPMISIIPINNSLLSNIQSFCRLFSYQLTQWLGTLSVAFVFLELFLFLLCAVLLLCLLKSKNQTILKYSLDGLIFIYMISALLLFMQTQEIIQFLANQNTQTTSLQSSEHTIISILSIVNIFLIISLTVIYNLACHSYSTTVLNHLCKKFCLKSCIIDFIFKIMLATLPSILSMLKNPQKTQFVAKMSIVYTSLYLAINIFKQYNQIRYFTYLSIKTSRIYRLCITFQFSIIMITLICLISSQILVIQNSVFVIFSLWVFLYNTLYYYLSNRDQYYQLLELEEITNPLDAEMYIWQLNKLFSEGGDKQSLILSNIKKNHEQICSDPSCICKQISKEQEKNEANDIRRQNTNVRIGNKKIKVLTSVQITMNYQRMLIIDILDRICENYPDAMDVILLISYIKLKAYSVFGDTLWKLNRLTRNAGKSMTNKMGCREIYNRIFVEKFIISLRNVIISRNTELQISQTEQCLESDELVEQMIKKYERIIELKAQFWKFFSKGVVVHIYFQKVINEQIQMMKQFYKFNQYLKQKFKNSYLLVSLMIGYEKFVLFKQKISRDLAELVKLSILTHSHQNIFKVQKSKGQKQSVQRWVLSSMCCTFEALINFEQLGTVISTSKNIQTVFGYKPDMINGSNINRLMPKSMQEQHDHILNSWAKKCSWTNLGKIRNIFCIDRNNVSFSCGVYLKFLQRQSSINVIASIFKENDEDYMIVDQNGIIVGAGSRFLTLLGSVLVGLPLKFVCTQSRNIKKWALQNNRIRHRTIFFSIQEHSQILQKFLQNKYSIDGQIAEQGVFRDEQTHGHVVQMEVYPYNIGRILFSVIKIESIISENMALTYRNPSMMGSQTNLYNYEQKQYYSKAELKPESSITGGKLSSQNIFACNSSVGSSNSNRKMSMQNNVDRFQDIFYQKQPIFDKKILKIMVFVLTLCAIGLGTSSYKISFNSKGFLQMQEILFADGACSDNLQLSMFLYNRGLSINGKLQAYMKTQNETQYKILKQQIDNQQYEQKYLHRLVIAQIQDMNKNLTSLSNIVMFKYEKELVTWLDEVPQSVTTTRFILNYVYLSNSIALLSQNISKLIKANSSKQQISSTKMMLEINLHKMEKNFPELYRLNSVNLQYYKNIFLQTQQKMLMVSYIKISITMIAVIVILCVIQRHYYYSANQIQGIYAEYKKFPDENVLAMIRYFIDFKLYLKEKNKKRRDGFILDKNQTTLTQQLSNSSLQLSICKDSERERLQNSAVFEEQRQKQLEKLKERFTQKNFPQVGVRKLQDHHEGIQSKLLKINAIYQSCSTDLLTKSQSTIKKTTLTIHEKKISLQFVICILTIILILSINIIMFKTEKSIMQTAEEIVTNINDLMDSQNIVISAYFQTKGAYTTTPMLSKSQSQTLLHNLLERINKTEVTFNKIAASSLYLFNAYDSTYPQKMIAILTNNICDITVEKLPEQHYRKCVQDQSMRMLQYGIMNSMNSFSRKIINNLYELIEITNSNGNSTAQASTISEVDKTLIYMFKIYQETQAQITSSFIVAIDNLMQQNLLLISVEYLFFFLVIVFMPVFYRNEQQSHINRIGRILLIPIKILQANRQIMRNFQKVIDYDDIK